MRRRMKKEKKEMTKKKDEEENENQNLVEVHSSSCLLHTKKLRTNEK
jgi:hypothetical protein